MEKISVLAVGLVCLDIVNVCDHYPQEDEDTRATASDRFRGGNAANTLAVLQQLCPAKFSSFFMGTMADDSDARYLRENMQARSINTDLAVVHPNRKTPTSYIIRNSSNGSRTIVNYRDLPELVTDDFTAIAAEKLRSLSWVHFEGRRNMDDIAGMMKQTLSVRAANAYPKISLELEKTKNHDGDLASFVQMADVVFFSKDIALGNGFSTAYKFLEHMSCKAKPGSTLVCAWGELGADAVVISLTGLCAYSHCDIFPPERVIDTLGAGDSFNAGVIFALSQRKTVSEALEWGCRVAGAKCGRVGLDGITLTSLGFEMDP